MNQRYEINWWALRIFGDILAFCIGIVLYQLFKYHLLTIPFVFGGITLFIISAYLIGLAKRHLKVEATK